MDTSLRSVWQEIAKYDKERQVGMTKNLSFWVSETNEKSIRMLRYTLILWILRCAQYDKENNSVMTNKGRNCPLFSQPKGKLQSKPAKPQSQPHTHKKSPKFMDTSLCYAKFSMTRKDKVSMTKKDSFIWVRIINKGQNCPLFSRYC